MARKVWIQLVDERSRRAFMGFRIALVTSDAVNDIKDLRKKIHAKYDHTQPPGTNILARVAAGQLIIYANRAAYDAMKEPLEEDLLTGKLGGSKKNALIVELPPVLSQQSFFWKEPKSLVATTGANWDFQNSLDLCNLASAIGRLYQAWSDEKTDKRNHPLFVCLELESRDCLTNFQTSCSSKFCDETQRDSAMKQLLQTAYSFKITVENGTNDNYDISDPRRMIGTRMLYQLQESDWTMFNANSINQVFPTQVLSKLSAITGTDSNRLYVILCVDSLQKLQHEPGSKHSEFYTAFASLCDLVNASKCRVIVICAATICHEFLAASPQWTEMLRTTSLKRPKINKLKNNWYTSWIGL